jgi:hypothetical protein
LTFVASAIKILGVNRRRLAHFSWKLGEERSLILIMFVSFFFAKIGAKSSKSRTKKRPAADGETLTNI